MDEDSRQLVSDLVEDVQASFKNFQVTDGQTLDLTDEQAVRELYHDAMTLRGHAEIRKVIAASKRELDSLEADKRALASQQAQAKLQLEAYEDMKKTIDAMAVYVREHYAAQIAAGKHDGLRLEAVLIRYLGSKPVAPRVRARRETKRARPGEPYRT